MREVLLRLMVWWLWNSFIRMVRFIVVFVVVSVMMRNVKVWFLVLLSVWVYDRSMMLLVLSCSFIFMRMMRVLCCSSIFVVLMRKIMNDR